jgi:hypothetical protein
VTTSLHVLDLTMLDDATWNDTTRLLLTQLLCIFSEVHHWSDTSAYEPTCQT